MSEEGGKRGRPSVWDPTVAARICDELAAGKSLRAICRADDMPPESTVRSWALDDREGFFAHYTRARVLQAHAMFDEALEIADDGSNDTYIGEDGPRVDYDVLQRSRLRVDTRKWYLSKVLPKVYGDRVAMEHSGPNGGPIQTEDVTDLRERFSRRIAGIATRVGENGSHNGAHGNGAQGA